MALPSLNELARQQSVESLLTPDRQSSLLADLAKRTGQFVETLGFALDTPAAIARGVLAGDPLSGFAMNSDDRVSPEELNRLYGFESRNPVVNTLGGFATGVLTDPLFYFSGPLKAVTQAGRAASKAGLLKQAPMAFAKEFGEQAAFATPRGKYLQGLMQTGYVPTTTQAVQTLKPAGQRLAQRSLTLDQLVRQQARPQEAIDRLVAALGNRKAYDAVKGQRLAGDVRFGIGPLAAAFNLPGGESLAKGLDATSAVMRYSYPGRLAASAFSRRVKGAAEFGEQVQNMRLSDLEDYATRVGRDAAIKHNLLLHDVQLSDASKKLLGADTLYSAEGNDMLLRLAEGKGNATDLQILANTPNLKQWLTSWDLKQQQMFAERSALGLKGNRFQDKYKTRYVPRYGDEFNFDGMGKNPESLLFSAKDSSDLGRQQHLMTPGGTFDLRELSRLPTVIELSKPMSQVTDQQAAQDILAWFAKAHPLEPITEPQAVKIARSLARRSQQIGPDVPVFQAHPANTMARRIISSEVKKARAVAVYEAMAESAVRIPKGAAQPGRWRNLDDSWREIAAKSGFEAYPQATAGAAVKANPVADNAINRLKTEISRRSGVPIDQIDLQEWAVPERVVRRLERVNETYTSTKALQEIGGFLDSWTTLFKGFVLARPARFVRDAYSNAISIMLETGSAPQTFSTMRAASQIVAGKYDDAMAQLRKIPRYQSLGSDKEIVNAFIRDAGTNGVLSGLQTSELLSGSRTGRMGQLIPGSTPTSVSQGLRELVPDASTFSPEFLRRFGSIYGVAGRTQDTLNPILRASNTISDSVDSMGRLGGFMALLQQGYDPGEAASRIASALVDYGSLTVTERRWLRRIFPWYSYNSRIGKYVVQSLYEQPGGLYSQMIRANNTLQQSDDETYIPENLRAQFAVRLPDSVSRAFGLYDPENQTFLKDFDAPGIDVLNLLDPNSMQESIANVLRQSSPWLQAGASLATNRDLYYDRPLNETTTPLDRLYKAATGDPQNLSAIPKVFGNLVPGTQVGVSLLGALADDRIPDVRKRAIKALVNFLSGVKIADVDKEYLLYDLQRKIDDVLQDKTYTFSRSYIPEGLQPTLTPFERDVYALSKIKNKEAKALRDARKAKEARDGR